MSYETILADAGGFGHMNGYGHMNGNGWWAMMALGWIMGLIIIGLLVWTVVQGASPRRTEAASPPGARTAESILADRFARGEIDDDEYRRRLDTLRS